MTTYDDTSEIKVIRKPNAAVLGSTEVTWYITTDYQVRSGLLIDMFLYL